MKKYTFDKAKEIVKRIEVLTFANNDFKKVLSSFIPNSTFSISTHQGSITITDHKICKKILLNSIKDIETEITQLTKQFEEL